MTKKQDTQYVCVGDLDVGGILKNAKSESELNKRVIARLKNTTIGDTKTTWFDHLIKSGAIAPKSQKSEQPGTPE